MTSKCPRFLDILPEQKNECPGTEGSLVFAPASTRICCKDADLSVVFKVGQVRALEAVYLGKDVLTALPTGCGKSLIFQLILVKTTHSSGCVQEECLVVVNLFFASCVKFFHWKVE